MLASIPSATLHGVDGRPVAVEVHVSNGLPGFTVVGLPDAAVRESRDRVRAAVLSSGLVWPKHRVTVNLAPSGRRKGGAGLDLPIAMGLLVADGSLPESDVADTAFIGELGLDGSLRPVPGVVPVVSALACHRVVVPAECAGEARLVGGHEVRGVADLAQLVAALQSLGPWADTAPTRPAGPVLTAQTGSGRREGSGRRSSGPRGVRRRWPPPPPHGPARIGQDHARPRDSPAFSPLSVGDDALAVTRIHSAAGVSPAGGDLTRRPPSGPLITEAPRCR